MKYFVCIHKSEVSSIISTWNCDVREILKTICIKVGFFIENQNPRFGAFIYTSSGSYKYFNIFLEKSIDNILK